MDITLQGIILWAKKELDGEHYIIGYCCVSRWALYCDRYTVVYYFVGKWVLDYGVLYYE